MSAASKMSFSNSRRNKTFAVVEIAAHGELVKPRDVAQTRSVNKDAYPSDIYLLSTTGSDFIPSRTEKLEGSTWLSNEYLVPSILYNVIQDERISSMTGKQILDEIGRKIKPVDKAAGVKYKDGYTTTKNPPDMSIFWTRPNEGDDYRSFENPNYEGRRKMKKRRAEKRDIQWFGKHGVYFVYTNSPNKELQKMSLHGLKSSIHKSSEIDISRYGIMTPFIDPSELESIDIFGKRSSKKFESILSDIHCNTGSRPCRYMIDPKRGIQIIRRGAQNHNASLAELSQLFKDFDIDEVYVFSRACRQLEEISLPMVKKMWEVKANDDFLDTQSTSGDTITPPSSASSTSSVEMVESSASAPSHGFKRPRNTPRIHIGGKKRSYYNKYTKVNKKANTIKKCKKRYTRRTRTRTKC